MNDIIELNILAIGVDTRSIEKIKSAFKRSSLRYRIVIIKDVSEIEMLKKKDFSVVFYSSNKQNQKNLDDMRKMNLYLYQASIILLSQRQDQKVVTDGFRSGFFDFLSLPIVDQELSIAIYRLKILKPIHKLSWTPEKAILHLFSRPEVFNHFEEITLSLQRYIDFFFQRTDKTSLLISKEELIERLSAFELTEKKREKIHHFFVDQYGLIFGLEINSNEIVLILKHGANKFRLFSGKNKTSFHVKEILNEYLLDVLKAAMSALYESKKSYENKRLSLTDDVTGLFNQRKLYDDLSYYVERYSDEKREFCLLFIDLDHFKNVNDQYGHIWGSSLLKDVSVILKKQLRTTDLVYRYGGDEFIIMLPKANLNDALLVANRILVAVKEHVFFVEDKKTYRLSVSIGVAVFPDDAQTVQELIKIADMMMYESKKSGRGRVVHFKKGETSSPHEN